MRGPTLPGFQRKADTNSQAIVSLRDVTSPCGGRPATSVQVDIYICPVVDPLRAFQWMVQWGNIGDNDAPLTLEIAAAAQRFMVLRNVTWPTDARGNGRPLRITQIAGAVAGTAPDWAVTVVASATAVAQWVSPSPYPN